MDKNTMEKQNQQTKTKEEIKLIETAGVGK